MNTHVEFKSSAFPKYADEDDETVNPTRWGKRLAEFVRDNLPQHGVETEDILCEDWGWLVNTKNDSFPVWIGCGPVDDLAESEDEEIDSPVDSDGADTSLIEFALFVTAEPGFFQKLFKKIDTQPAIAKVVSALEKMIAAADEFESVEWSE